MKKEEAIERLKQNKAAAEFYAGMVQNTNAIENELKDIEAMNMAIEALTDRPTGKWINRGSAVYPWFTNSKCDQCGHYGSKMWAFCPNCGARMLREDGEA